MNEVNSNVNEMLELRERLESLRIIASQPEHKFYFQLKTIVRILIMTCVGVAIYMIDPVVLQGAIPIILIVWIVQLTLCGCENSRLTKKLDVIREMMDLEKQLAKQQDVVREMVDLEK